jgi:hypothetical protein
LRHDGFPVDGEKIVLTEMQAEQLGSNLGAIAANKTKRANDIDFISLLCKQGLVGSITNSL